MLLYHGNSFVNDMCYRAFTRALVADGMLISTLQWSYSVHCLLSGQIAALSGGPARLRHHPPCARMHGRGGARSMPVIMSSADASINFVPLVRPIDGSVRATADVEACSSIKVGGACVFS